MMKAGLRRRKRAPLETHGGKKPYFRMCDTELKRSDAISPGQIRKRAVSFKSFASIVGMKRC